MWGADGSGSCCHHASAVTSTSSSDGMREPPLERQGRAASRLFVYSAIESREGQGSGVDSRPGLFSMITVKHLFGGGVSGALAKSFTAPLERVKILWQTQRMHPSQGIVGTLKHLKATEGVKSYFRGNAVSIVRIFPYAGIQFAAYEQFRAYFLSDGRQELTPLQRLVAGSGAGVVSVICTYPLDVIRTRLAAELAAHPGEGKLLGIWHALKTVFEERSLWNGLSPTLLGIVPYAGINFFLYGYIKQMTHTMFDAYKKRAGDANHVEGHLPVPIKLAVGGVSGLISQTIVYPIDVVRRRMQAHPGELAYGMLDMLGNIYRNEGIVRGLFKGLSLNFIKTPPAVAISFVTYDKLKEVLNSGQSI
mmetsp:Transcript_17790/g.44125  ORF Transcript_17790/g.44125 Transcript_17790/m.44125 type:complete len:363 (-) Transcript_17790:55-1143(-)